VTAERNSEFSDVLKAISKNLPQGIDRIAFTDGHPTEDTAPQVSRVATFVRGQLVIALAALIEDCIAESMRLVIAAFPEKLESKGRTVDLREALWLKTVLDRAIDFEMLHMKGRALVRGVKRILFDPAITNEQWLQYFELRARRNAGLHNGWRANRSYLENREFPTDVESGALLYPTATYAENSFDLAGEMLKSLQERCDQKFGAYTRIAAFKTMWERSSLSGVVRFEQAWDYKPPTDISPGGLWGQDEFEWHWSHSESVMWQFFEHIFYGQSRCALPDLEFARYRLNQQDVEIIDEWLNYPFHL
jgi:hypothetical protein